MTFATYWVEVTLVFLACANVAFMANKLVNADAHGRRLQRR
jgi:hypothetical protein